MSLRQDAIPDININTTRHTPLKVHVDATIRNEIAAVGIVFKNHVGCILGRYNEVLGKGYDTEKAEQAALDRAIHITSSICDILLAVNGEASRTAGWDICWSTI